MDFEKQVQYWRAGADEEILAAKALYRDKLYTQCLFHAHLALEKILKAHVCRKTNDLAPWIHNLSRLAEKAQLHLSERFIDILADMNGYSLEGRYPDQVKGGIAPDECRAKLEQSEEVLRWLTAELSKA